MSVGVVTEDLGGNRRLVAGTYVETGSGTRLPRVYSTVRVCAEEDCSTLLSIYNPPDHCAIHGSGPTRAQVRRRQRTCQVAMREHELSEPMVDRVKPAGDRDIAQEPEVVACPLEAGEPAPIGTGTMGPL